jgi:hypothetical protein
MRSKTRMGFRLGILLGVLVAAAGACLDLPAVAGAQAPSQDSAVGTGATISTFGSFAFDARSDPSGGSPSGTASWELSVLHFEGSVSCLGVSGNRAVIGIEIDKAASSLNFADWFLTTVDGGPEGSGLDTFDAVPTFSAGLGRRGSDRLLPGACLVIPVPVIRGDIVVRDAPPVPTSKEQCKTGGWRNFPGFRSQGDCVSFLATGGRNPPGAGWHKSRFVP